MCFCSTQIFMPFPFESMSSSNVEVVLFYNWALKFKCRTQNSILNDSQLKNGQKSWSDNFIKENIWIGNRQRKTWSIGLVIREMQIKTRMRYYYIPITMAKSKKPTMPNVGKDVEFSYTVSESIKCTTLTVQQLIRKPNIYLIREQLHSRVLSKWNKKIMSTKIFVHECSWQIYSQ